MRFVYTILIHLVQGLFPVIAGFNPKMKQFVQGRRSVFDTLTAKLDSQKPRVWFHAASLGEYEQGVPVMKAIQEQYPEHQLVITFFSPSGYEIKKNNAFAKATTYLPLDTPKNARRFLDIIQPELAIFIKYEFWPNYLHTLQKRKIKTLLLSGVFNKRQLFFKPYGKWMIKALHAFDHFFIQDEASEILIRQLGFDQVTQSGDTRFDRVAAQLEMDNTLNFMEVFKDDALCVVCGSTWPEDESILASYINNHKGVARFVIAPHQIKEQQLVRLEHSLLVNTVRYSQMTEKDPKYADVLIIDTIGLLSKIYSYADLAYVGGALGNTGLHNILEPATFGIPILTGPHIERFPEAQRLRQLAGLYTVSEYQELKTLLDKLLLDASFRAQTGMIAGHFINSNTGATRTVMDYITSNLK